LRTIQRDRLDVHATPQRQPRHHGAHSAGDPASAVAASLLLWPS
jgi:hypothetical protein